MMSADSAGDQERFKRATAVLLHMAATAREDPAVFFEFVMRHEVTNEPLRLAPHQRLILDFVLDHAHCALLLPVGASKTSLMTALGLWFLGREPSFRGAIVSATEDQAKKPLLWMRQYIEQAGAISLVFPHLRRSPLSADKWTDSAFTVQRDVQSRDPSVAAYSTDSSRIIGSRLKWILADDLLGPENTATPEQRKKTSSWVQSVALNRLDTMAHGGDAPRFVLSNSAWHHQDYVHEAIDGGLPALKMDIEGNITILNDDDWDRDYLRPAHVSSSKVRLRAHDPDPKNEVPLWPERFPREKINELRFGANKKMAMHPLEFARAYMCECRDDASALCKSEWIEACKRKAREMKVHGFVQRYTGKNITFTGIDLAVSPGEEHDDTCFFTYEMLPNGLRKILEIDDGQWDGPTIVAKLIDKHRRYKSVVRVENNAAQDFIRQFALAADAAVPVKAHTTGRAKAHPEHGVPGLFTEIYNAAWLIPTDPRGQVHPATQRWIDGCLNYVPGRHTDDRLMAMWFAREQAREFGMLQGSEDPDQRGGGIGAAITAR